MRLFYVPRTRATRPRWVLGMPGVPCALVRLEVARGETRSAEHLARHPLGHVSVLEEGAPHLHESAAIPLWARLMQLGEGLPAVDAWLARSRERPGWRRATAD